MIYGLDTSLDRKTTPPWNEFDLGAKKFVDVNLFDSYVCAIGAFGCARPNSVCLPDWCCAFALIQ